MAEEGRARADNGRAGDGGGARIAAVVLAAGASRRLGEPKQLVQIGGESLLRRSARLAADVVGEPVFVVLGFAAERMRAELTGLAVEAVVNEEWQEGMGSSLRRGVEVAAAARPEVDGLLVMVCDQPRLTAEHLRQLIARHGQAGESRAVTASFYGGSVGVPAVFARRLFGELLAVQGDRGAKQVIEAHPADTGTVVWPEGEIDLDWPEQLGARSYG